MGDQCLPGDIESACGAKGAACSSCAVGQECQGQSGGGGKCEGTSTCGPSNCNGCCNALGQCVTGTDSTACGKQGQACEACDGGEVCVGAGPNAGTCQPLPTCGPGNCAGCCVNNSCVTATTPAACGANGQACVACGVNEVCSPQGTCVPSNPCASTCAGCCIGENCAPGTSTTACGTGGATCQNCSTIGRVCQSRSCQVPSCSPANCPNGCCSGNTCVVGTQHNACGPTGGGACTNCEAAGEVCQGRQCREKCGPLNCDGCCRPDNTCVLGLTNNACGQDGVTCSNCTTTGSFCNGLVTPRRCNDQQSTCPAPYGECPDGVRVPARPALQKLCTGPNLNTLTTACASGPHHPNCVAAFAALPDACRTCLEPFNVPFVEKAGLYACVASSVSPQCRRDMGCAIDCSRTSCTQCMSTSTDQCYALVNGNGGQCFTFDDDASCADAALSNGLCSSFAYPHFGAWLRSVGDHFCGDGP
ncbi:MAG TPA: hypothetical protein VM580_18330 [Labilithrix sp.]|nr:hypothetical protein [Labilithrix sp.]